MTNAKEFLVINPKELVVKAEFFWRYMDVYKFLDFIQNAIIRFARMDTFEDPLEGIPLKTILQFAEPHLNALMAKNTFSDALLNPALFNSLPEEAKKHILDIKRIQHRSYVSCWYKSEVESMAMWGLYSTNGGIVIKINPRVLIQELERKFNSLISINQDWVSGYVGKVRYQNFESLRPFQDNEHNKTPKVGLRKERSYEHENEIRFVINVQDENNDSPVLSIPLDFELLKGATIITHPKMKDWQFNAIKNVMATTNTKFNLKKSSIRLRY